MEPVGATSDWHSCATRPQGSVNLVFKPQRKKEKQRQHFKTKNGKGKLVVLSEAKLSHVAPVNTYLKTWH